MNHRNSPSDCAEPRREEVDALAAALRGLPDLQPPERIWTRVQVRASRRRWRAPLALAAGLAVAALAAAVVMRFAPALVEDGQGDAAVVQTESAAPSAPAEPTVSPEFAALLARSQQLEDERRQAPFRLPPIRVERVLLDEIRNIDDSLNRRFPAVGETPANYMLLNARVDLMQGLVAIERSRREALRQQAALVL